MWNQIYIKLPLKPFGMILAQIALSESKCSCMVLEIIWGPIGSEPSWIWPNGPWTPIGILLCLVPQTDLSEWGSDGLLKDPVGVTPHRRPVRRSTFVRRLRTWGHLLSSRLREMVAHATLAEKNTVVLTHCASQTPLGTKSVFSAKISICSEGGVPSVSALFKYI